MAKLNENPIEAHDLQEYLDAEDDFAFELSIYRMCLDTDSQAQHAGTYQDPVSMIDRQFDIRMRLYRGNSVLDLAIECKRLKSYFPLLVSRVPRSKGEAFHESVVRGESALWDGGAYWATRHGGDFYIRGKLVGKSTNQIGRRPSDQLKNLTSAFFAGDAEVYEKWSQAIASAVRLVEQAANFKEILDENTRVIVLPILVVPDNTLWVVDYDEDGRQSDGPRQTSECTIFLGKTFTAHKDVLGSFPYTISHLHIMTKYGLGSFLAHRENYWGDLFNLNN